MSSRATQPLEIIHSDIAGPINPRSLGGALYLLMFTDDYTRFKIGYLIKRKSEALMCFKDYKALAEKHHGKPIRKLRTDGGGEYTSNEFSYLLKEEGIEAQRTTPYTPQSNGMSKRANTTIIGTTRALLHAVNAPKEYWGEAAMTAIYMRNRLPTKVLAKGGTPYELWFGRKPAYVNLRIWGCLAYVRIPEETRKKLDKTAQRWMFIGYTDTTKQYRLYDPVNKRFLISRDVVFQESTAYFPLEGFEKAHGPQYYTPAIQPWEERIAWNDEFDEQE